jgi:putative ABC transport system permease protein
MLEPRWRKVWRDAWMHRARTILVVVAIALGLVGAGSILNAWALVQRATKEGYLASDPAAATLRTDSIDSTLLDAVRRVPGVRGAEARRTMMASMQVQGFWQPAMLFAMPDVSRTTIGAPHAAAGAWPPADGTLVVEHSSVDFSGAQVGQTVQMVVGDRPAVSLGIAGIARDVTLAPGWMEHVVYAFVSPGTLRQLGVPSTMNELQIVVDNPAPTQDEVRVVANAVKQMLEKSGHPVSNVDVPVPGEHVHAAQMDSLLYTQGAFGALALVVCGFLVVNLMAAMLSGQVREIGVMKTLGAQPAQLARMYLTFAAALGVLSSLLALPVSIAIGRRYGALKGELLNFDISAYSIPWWVIVLQLAVGVLLPVLAAWLPVRRGCRLPVSAALRDFGLDRDASESSNDWMARLGGFSRPVLVSVRNAFRKRQRMLLTLLALATGGAVFLGAANLRAAVVAAIDQLFESQRYTFSVRLTDPHAPDSVETVIAAVSGVSGAEAWSGARGTIAGAGGLAGNAFGITAPPAATKRYVPRMVAGRWPTAADGAALVAGEALVKREPSLTLGAHVPVEIDGVTTSWLVVGIVDAGPQPSAFAAREAIATVTGRTRTSAVVVATTGDGVAAQVDVIQRVRAALEAQGMNVASTSLVDENRRVMQDHLLMVVDFLSVMGWVMIAVGGMGLASTMGLAVLERTREIGVLRAIGAGHGAILLMVQVEGIVIALLGWLVALPLSVPMSIALGKAFGRVMLEVPVRYLPEGTGVVRWLALSVVVSAVACSWPALRATRITVAQALAYE